MLISETHFTEKSYFKTPNYHVYDTKHPSGKAHGGSAILIKSTIKHYECLKNTDDYLQATTVTIEDWNGPITLSAVYCPPKHTIKCEMFSSFFKELGHRFIACGDYNAKHPWWGSRSPTPSPRGRQLYEAMQKNHLFTLSTGEPTYWPSDKHKLPDLIDFAVVKGINPNYFTAKSCLDLSSDHSPVIITLNTKIQSNKKISQLYNKKTNWTKYKEFLNNSLSCNISLKTPDELENAIENLNIQIHKAIFEASPQCIKSSNNYNNNISKKILDKIHEKRTIRKIWQKTRTKNNKTKLNKVTKDLKRMLYEERNENIQNYLENLTPTEATDYSLWKATKTRRPQPFTPPIRQENGSWARSDPEKANLFAEHLCKIFEPLKSNITEQEENRLLENTDQSTQEKPAKNVKAREVQRIIRNLKDKKTPGYDRINGKILKEFPPKATRLLTIIINAIFRLNYFPDQWKVAQIVLIPKPGKNPESVSSYRPISLLPTMSKVCEKIILNRLNPIIREKNLIPSHQFGFRNRHGTIEQVNRITATIRNAFESKKYCTAVFLDVAQAFDKVWHKGLLNKLKRYLPKSLYKLLKSYLKNRTFQVKINDTVTDLFSINAGVPQGSVLGPTLYLLYTADIPVMDNTSTATYADDTAVLSTHSCPISASIQLQNHLNKIEDWFKLWRVKINEDKSTHITFTLRKDTCPPVYLNGKTIPQNESVKYLGMHLDRRLTWKNHIWTKRKQLNLKTRKLYWLLGNQSKLALSNKILLYKSILKPIWTYGIQLWGSASDSNINIIERYQSKTLRNMVNAPWFIPNELINKDLNISTVKEETKKFHQKYKNRLSKHPNELATELLTKNITVSRLKKYKIL